MITILKISAILVLASSLCNGQHKRQEVPVEVLLEAQEAVDRLAKEVIKENYLYSLDHMYPRWKTSMAKQVGGEAALKARLESVPEVMVEKGIKIIDLKVGKSVSAFEVRGELMQDSKQAPVFREYLVLVPTTTIYRLIDPNGGVVTRLESKGFQAAIKGKEAGSKWSFIDGAKLTLADLRGLFPHLPESAEAMNFPERGWEKIK